MVRALDQYLKSCEVEQKKSICLFNCMSVANIRCPCLEYNLFSEAIFINNARRPSFCESLYVFYYSDMHLKQK